MPRSCGATIRNCDSPRHTKAKNKVTLCEGANKGFKRVSEESALEPQPNDLDSARSFSAHRGGASPEGPHIIRQIPDVLVRFDSSKSGHPAQTNSILYNPEQFAIRIFLHLRRCEIRGARIHPATGVSGCVAVETMACRAFGAEEFVSFFDARP